MRRKTLKMKAPQYHSAEVYNHIARAKKRKRFPKGEEIPFELRILAWVFASIMVIFVSMLMLK